MSHLRQVNKVRFWVYENSTWIKICLRKGDDLEFYFSETTEEGFQTESTIYSFDGEVVSKSYASWSRDCDGNMSNRIESECQIGNLRSAHVECIGYGPGEAVPDWKQVKSNRRDYQAEAAGY
jgi:hypothetical protein